MPSRSTPSLLVSAPVPEKERVAPTVGTFSSVALISPSGHGRGDRQYGLSQAYKRMDNKQAAAEVDEILDKTWVADAGMLDMTRM
ncbi:MAG: hypothetical protein ACRED0_10725 [Gammaproteobacteria bacterium]